MAGMCGCLGRVYIGLRRFTQNGCISAFQCCAEVLKSAFLRVWKFCVAFCEVNGNFGNIGLSKLRKGLREVIRKTGFLLREVPEGEDE